MRAPRPGLGLLLSALLGGCTLALPFDECGKDADCPMAGGRKRFCSADRLCVTHTPTDRMCREVYPRSPPQNAVPVGAILNLPTDQLSFQALQLGVDEINDLARSGPRPLVLYLCNTGLNGGTDEDALAAMKHLVREKGVVAVVGPTSSGEVISVAPEAGRGQVPLVSPSATAPAVSQLPQRGFIFRVAPSDELQGKVLANLVAGARTDSKLGLLFVDDTYGRGLQLSFLQAWEGELRRSMPVVSRSFKEEDAAAVAQATRAVIDAMPPLTDVVAITYLDTPAVVRQLQGLRSEGPGLVRLWMADGAKNQALLDVLKDMPPPSAAHFQRISGTAPGVSATQFSGFRSAFSARFGGMDPSSDAFSAYSYDALYAIAIAIGNGKGEPTGPLVAAGLRRISGNDALTAVGRNGYLEGVRKMGEGRNVPLDGASGKIRFNDRGDRVEASFERWGVDPAAQRFTSATIM